jgi:Tol biopolymer transport system component
LPERLPEPLHRLLRRCLVKDPGQRLHDIADARLEIDEALQPPEGPPAARNLLEAKTSSADVRPDVHPGFRWSKLAVAALLLLAAGIGWWLRDVAAPRSASTEPLIQSIWTLPPGLVLDSAPAISPDGRRLAFTASQKKAGPRLYVRTLDTLNAEAIAGTDGAKQPFWSPDSQSLAYFAQGKLMRVGIGGSPVEVCEARDARGGAWSSAGIIVFSPNSYDRGLMRVPAGGGTPEPATQLDRTQGENSHRWPVFLPDGIHFVYFVRSSLTERRGVYLGNVNVPAATPGALLFRSESEALFAAADSGAFGVLLSVADGHVEARPFDTQHLAVSGDPIRLPLRAGGNTPHHATTLSVSSRTLVYLEDPLPYGSKLVTTRRTGAELDREGTAGIITWPRVSPDGRRLAIQRLDPVTGNPDLWVHDLERHTRLPPRRELVSAGGGSQPVWAADGRELLFVDPEGILRTVPVRRGPDGRPVLANATQVAVPPIGTGHWGTQYDLSPDGRIVYFLDRQPDSTPREIGIVVGWRTILNR